LALPKPKAADGGGRLGAFFGSSIGNFTPLEAVRFLRSLRTTLGSGAVLLVGVDLKKDSAMLEAAYDDAQGVTAAFNLNLLARINRELDGDIDLKRFRHRARYNPAQGRVEMHLECLEACTATVAGRSFAFAAGETIHTENSYKYRPEEFQEMAASAGFTPARAFVDPDGLFSLHALRAP
jgi:dimethylhistidine N-methyltransferase